MNGEEVYGFNGLQKSVRPGQFLILNNDQPYSSRINTSEKIKSLSIFFRKEFAAAVFQDATQWEETSLDNPFEIRTPALEFFQTLYSLDESFQKLLVGLITRLDSREYANHEVDEDLVLLLHHLVRIHKSEVYRSGRVDAIKSGTKAEIYKRLCIAKDLLHSIFMHKVDLSLVSHAACLSVPQLIRQFKSVFQTTPHQYLMHVRLDHGARLLKTTDKPITEIAIASGFENSSAFCRAFKTEYGMTPLALRIRN